MRIREFGVETWMDRRETGCRFNLAETSVESLTVGREAVLVTRGAIGAGHLVCEVLVDLGTPAVTGR